METSDSNNKDAHSYFSELVFFSSQRSLKHHYIHIFVSFDVEHNVET